MNERSLYCELVAVQESRLGIRVTMVDESTGQKQNGVIILNQEETIHTACRYLAKNNYLVLAPAPEGGTVTLQ